MDIKRIALMAVVIVASALMWWSSHAWLTTEGRFADWKLFIWPALAVIVLGALVGLAWALLPSRLERFAVSTASWATLAVFFDPNIWYVSMLPIFLLLWLDASRRIQRETKERYKVRIRSIVGAGAKFILLGVFLLISLGFYLTPVGSSINVDTVSGSLQRTVDSSYGLPVIRDRLADLPPSLQGQFKRDMAVYVDEYAQQWLGPIASFLPPLLALALFLGLWGISGIMRELVLAVAAGLFMLLKSVGFVQIGEEDVTKEVLKLK
jgi:hypothetical protein